MQVKSAMGEDFLRKMFRSVRSEVRDIFRQVPATGWDLSAS
jgi:hypothetical protein